MRRINVYLSEEESKEISRVLNDYASNGGKEGFTLEFLDIQEWNDLTSKFDQLAMM